MKRLFQTKTDSFHTEPVRNGCSEHFAQFKGKFNSIANKYGCESILIPSIKANRQLYFGIAIILVILYHTWCKTPLLILAPFQKGSIGVDIFLFLSGFGLSYSYIKNSTARFYLNRLYRIYPIFIVFATYRSLIYIYEGDYLSVWDWICNLTTLSYYQIGGRIFDWYVAAIIILYLSFPLLFRISRWQIVISIAFLITAAFWFLGRPYFIYECLISRIPIFMAGIVAYRDARHLWLVILGFILCSPLAIMGVKSSPLGTCMIVFILIAAISFILNHKILPPPIQKFIYLCGKYSFELFLGNGAALSIKYPSFVDNDYSKAIFQLVLTLAFGTVFGLINNGISRLINRYDHSR